MAACNPLRARAERRSWWRRSTSRDFRLWPTHDTTKLENSYWTGLRQRRGRDSEKFKTMSLVKLHLLTVLMVVGRRSWGLILAVQHHTFIIHKPVFQSSSVSSSGPPLNHSDGDILSFLLLLPSSPFINTWGSEDVKRKCIRCRKRERMENSFPSVSYSKETEEMLEKLKFSIQVSGREITFWRLCCRTTAFE